MKSSNEDLFTITVKILLTSQPNIHILVVQDFYFHISQFELHEISCVINILMFLLIIIISKPFTCHWWWSHWWYSICDVGPPQLLWCGIVLWDVSWPGWHVPSSEGQECCRSHWSLASGSAQGSAGWPWCSPVRRARHCNTHEHKVI